MEVQVVKDVLLAKIGELEQQHVATANLLKAGPVPQEAAKHENKMDAIKHEMKTLKEQITKMDYDAHVARELSEKEEHEWKQECLNHVTVPQLKGILGTMKVDYVRDHCTGTEIKAELHKRGEKL